MYWLWVPLYAFALYAAFLFVDGISLPGHNVFELLKVALFGLCLGAIWVGLAALELTFGRPRLSVLVLLRFLGMPALCVVLLTSLRLGLLER